MLALMVAAVLAAADPPAGGNETSLGPIRDPVWRPFQYPGSLERYYPPAALESGIDGAVAVECAISSAGAFENCKVIAEAPRGQGFGPAATTLASFARIAPTTASGAPTIGRTIKVGVRFRF